MKTISTLIANIMAVLVLISAPARAAQIFTNEAALDSIFSQATFGSETIDIRCNTPVTILAPAFTDLTVVQPAGGELPLLFALAPTPSPSVNLFFVDNINVTGPVSFAIAGIGDLPGNNIVVAESFASGASGAELIAHELGHNLGLVHDYELLDVLPGPIPPPSNLMNPILNGNTTLTGAQAASVLSSPLVQGAPGARYIEITPIAVVASVPEPSVFSFLVIVGLSLASRKRRSPPKHSPAL